MASLPSQRIAWLAASLLALLGCTVAVENPPAYDAERDLCAAKRKGEWERRLASCRDEYEADASCGGLISFTGQLEGEPLTVDSELGASEFSDRVNAEGAELREDVKLQGRSPYFVFTFEWRGLGADLSSENGPRTLSFGAGVGGQESLEDELVRGALRMTVGGETRAFAPRGGSLVIERQTQGEQVATFETNFGGSDDLTGCFHAFAVKHSIVRDVAADAGL
ncbi:MAG TPA: hypothetical protein VK524_25840 [Polyangiaceae bacterium]|nr:hypothetical protein [Polyangiaceae bacterium]